MSLSVDAVWDLSRGVVSRKIQANLSITDGLKWYVTERVPCNLQQGADWWSNDVWIWAASLGFVASIEVRNARRLFCHGAGVLTANKTFNYCGLCSFILRSDIACKLLQYETLLTDIWEPFTGWLSLLSLFTWLCSFHGCALHVAVSCHATYKSSFSLSSLLAY